MKYTANVIGATGLVGKQLVKQLLENENFELIRLFVRRLVNIDHPKLEIKIVDFTDEKTWKSHLSGEVLFSALGTTLKQAGSKEKQFEIDYTSNFNFAKAAFENGIENYVLVSSVGANPNSKIFYTKIKGQLDDAVSKIGFKNLAVIRPASLIGDRREKRFAEVVSIPILMLLTRFVLKNYRPIADKTVAKAMINAVLKPDSEKTIWEAGEVFQLADEK